MQGVLIIPLSQVHTDPRRAIHEAGLPEAFSVVRINRIKVGATAPPEMKLGGHLHPNTTEWFILAVGSFGSITFLRDGKKEVYSDVQAPCLVLCSPGVGHTFEGAAPGTILITLADQPYDPSDTVPL